MASKRGSGRPTQSSRSSSRGTRSGSGYHPNDRRSSSRPSARPSNRQGAYPSGRPSTRSGYTPTGRPSSRTGRVSSVSVGEVAQYGRNQRMQQTYRRYVMRLGVIVGIIAVLFLCALGVYYSPAFGVEEVHVDGAEHLTAQEMSALAAVPENTTLLRVDAKTIRSNIMRDAWIKDVKVKREFPHTLVLDVTERGIAATVTVSINDGEDSQLWAIGQDGMWLCPIPPKDSEEAKTVSPKIYEDADKVFSITDVPYGVIPEVGSYCSDDSVTNAMEVVTGLTTNLKKQVVKVSATSTETTTLTLKSGVEIAFGKAEDIRTKERVCLKIMEENPGKVAYINVRVVSSPTWRSLS